MGTFFKRSFARLHYGMMWILQASHQNHYFRIVTVSNKCEHISPDNGCCQTFFVIFCYMWQSQYPGVSSQAYKLLKLTDAKLQKFWISSVVNILSLSSFLVPTLPLNSASCMFMLLLSFSSSSKQWFVVLANKDHYSITLQQEVGCHLDVCSPG